MGRKMKPHQKKYYGSLVVIMFLIVATAMLLTNEGNDLTGMATYETALKKRSSFYAEVTDAEGREEIWTGYYDEGVYIIKNKDEKIVSTYDSYDKFYEAYTDIYFEAEKVTAYVQDADMRVVETYKIDSEGESSITTGTQPVFGVTSAGASGVASSATVATLTAGEETDFSGKTTEASYDISTNLFTIKYGSGTTETYKIVNRFVLIS